MGVSVHAGRTERLGTAATWMVTWPSVTGTSSQLDQRRVRCGRGARTRSMLASRSLVSVLVRALGDFSLHPQDRPAGGLRPPSAGKTTLVGDEAVCLERHRGAGVAARARLPATG